MKSNKYQKGFTLAELLVVVAIIAILIAVSVPIFTSRTEETRETTCAANRRAAKALLAKEYMSGETMPAEKKDLSKQPGFPAFKDTVCPSDGGTICYETRDGGVIVYCTKHAPIDNMGTLADKIAEIIKKYGFNTMDSEAAKFSGSNSEKFVETLSAEGIDLNAINVKAWKLDGTAIYWTNKSISDASSGDPIVIMKYNYSGTYKGAYSVWTATVGRTNICSQANGEYYNVINIGGKELTSSLSADIKKDFDAINEIFEENTK